MENNEYNFEILRQTDEMIELKSRYHYWRMVRIRDTRQYILSHKHNKEDTYHQQYIQNHSFMACYRYIAAHDRYVDTLNQ